MKIMLTRCTMELTFLTNLGQNLTNYPALSFKINFYGHYCFLSSRQDAKQPAKAFIEYNSTARSNFYSMLTPSMVHGFRVVTT